MSRKAMPIGVQLLQPAWCSDIMERTFIFGTFRMTLGTGGYFGADKIAFYINTKYPSEFETVVGRYSQVTEKTRRDIESNLTQGDPIILDLKIKHIVVLVGFNETGFFVHDPSGALILDLGMPYQRHNIHRFVAWDRLKPKIIDGFLSMTKGSFLTVKLSGWFFPFVH